MNYTLSKYTLSKVLITSIDALLKHVYCLLQTFKSFLSSIKKDLFYFFQMKNRKSESLDTGQAKQRKRKFEDFLKIDF